MEDQSKEQMSGLRHGGLFKVVLPDPLQTWPEGQDFNTDLDFVYADTDTHTNEVAELYSYTELPEFQQNVKAFEEVMEGQGLSPAWNPLAVEKKRAIVLYLLDQLDVSDRNARMKAARCLLYLLQGCWAEAQSDADQLASEKANIILLYNLGAFHALVDLLSLEVEGNSLQRKCVSDQRVILNTLYLFLEGIRSFEDNEETAGLKASFRADLWTQFGGELLAVKLLSMILRFTQPGSAVLPMKKVLLVLWKVLLVSLGGTEELWIEKQKRRAAAGLSPLDKDTVEVVKTLRSSSPPASAAEVPDKFKPKRSRRALVKQSSLDEPMDVDHIQDPDDDYDESPGGESPPPASPRSTTPLPSPGKGLPWSPKVRTKDLDYFLNTTRVKFVGFQVKNDRESLVGLPPPIHEGVRVLKQHIYTSLAEIQMEEEEKACKTPFLMMNEKNEDPALAETNHVETLYKAIFPQAPQYMIALLKILLAASPTAKAKSDSLNIMIDVLPEEMPMTVVQGMKLSTDISRHKEIVTKAVAAILLLLLKHFKLNHIYQFEFIAQHLVFANCMPLVLKFFNQNIANYVHARMCIPLLEFPACFIGEQLELTAENLEVGDNPPYSWRNLFTCINLLRILNKLAKNKYSRIMMLVVFKSAPILKRSLKVRQAMMQLYALKLLKMQTKYLGRQWRKSNMKTLSAIYQKVRHRFGDDWAYGNDMESRPWDFQVEESKLRANVDRFNARRYSTSPDPEFTPVDNCTQSVLAQQVELTDHFKQHYNLWLQQEVFSNEIKWELLLGPTYM